jgi:hypothetical protein
MIGGVLVSWPSKFIKPDTDTILCIVNLQGFEERAKINEIPETFVL